MFNQMVLMDVLSDIISDVSSAPPLETRIGKSRLYDQWLNIQQGLTSTSCLNHDSFVYCLVLRVLAHVSEILWRSFTAQCFGYGGRFSAVARLALPVPRGLSRQNSWVWSQDDQSDRSGFASLAMFNNRDALPHRNGCFRCNSIS